MNYRAALNRCGPYLVMLLFCLLFYAPSLRADVSLGTEDYWNYFYPVRAYAVASLREGRIGEWTEALFGGFPLASDPQTGTFYPIHMLLPLFTGNPLGLADMNALTLIHVLALAMGGVFFARSLLINGWAGLAVGAIISFNGFFLYTQKYTSMVESMAAGVWTLGFLVRALRLNDLRLMAAAALAYSFCCLAGHMQTVLFTGYAAAFGATIYGLREGFRKRKIRTAVIIVLRAAGILAFGIIASSVLLLPMSVLVQEAGRQKLTLEAALVYPLPWLHAPGFFLPGLYQALPLGQFSSTGFSIAPNPLWNPRASYELGMVALILGIFGLFASRRRVLAWSLFIVAVVLFTMGVGERPPLYVFAFHYLPGFDRVRVVQRLLWLYYLSWGGLAALAIDALLDLGNKLRVRRSALIFAIFIVAVSAGGAITAIQLKNNYGDWKSVMAVLVTGKPEHSISVDQLASAAMQTVILLAVLGLSVLLLAVVSTGHGRRTASVCFLSALFLELLLLGFKKNVYPAEWLAKDTVPPAYKVVDNKKTGRVLFLDKDAQRLKNYALTADDRYAGGYNPLETSRTTVFAPRPATSLSTSFAEARLHALWNVDRLLVKPGAISFKLGNQMRQMPDWGWLHLSGRSDLSPRKEAAVYLDSPEIIETIHLIAAGAHMVWMDDNYPVAKLSLLDRNSSAVETYTIQAGRHVSDWSYELPEIKANVKHAKAPLAFHKSLNPGYFSGGDFSLGTFNIKTTTPVSALKLEMTPQGSLYVQGFGVKTRGTPVVDMIPAILSANYRLSTNESEEYQLVHSSNNYGKAWMVPTATWHDDNEDLAHLRATVLSANFNPMQTTVIEKIADGPINIKNTNAPDPRKYIGNAAVKRTIPEKITVKTTANQAGWLIISESYYPGWRAKVDGQSTDIYPANGAFMAISVPKGNHSVSLEFQTPNLMAGAVASVLFWIVAIGSLLMHPVKAWVHKRS